MITDGQSSGVKFNKVCPCVAIDGNQGIDEREERYDFSAVRNICGCSIWCCLYK